MVLTSWWYFLGILEMWFFPLKYGSRVQFSIISSFSIHLWIQSFTVGGSKMSDRKWKTSFVSFFAVEVTYSDGEKMRNRTTSPVGRQLSYHEQCGYTPYIDRTHSIHWISYPCTLIVFCRNRVIKDVWRCLRRLKRVKRTFITSLVDFGFGHIGFFQNG